MKLDEGFVNLLKSIIDGARLFFNEPMKSHTTFKIGGPADCLIFPQNIEEVRRVISLVHEHRVPLVIIGNGSNVLVRDKGVRGVVLKFGEAYGNIRQNGQRIIADAGALLKDVSAFAARGALSGLEFACGIPGSLGGAVFMNAGAYGGEMKNVVESVTSVDLEGVIKETKAKDLDLDYRHSVYQKSGDAICEVTLLLQDGDKDEITKQMAEFTRRREEKQPLNYPSAGSTFKRPTGFFAGTLIDETGLKGFQVGGAQVSEKHAGFVVNSGNATAKDVLELIAEVSRRVYEARGVKLYPEVRIIGEE